MYDFYLGGKDNFQVDRDTGRRMIRLAPEVLDVARTNRAFLQRAVRYLVRDAGIRQIIDIGTGLPTAGNVTETARDLCRETRIICVDNDPIVYIQARALLSGGEGNVVPIQADARDPHAILAHPEVRALIDFTQPVAVLFIAILNFIADNEDPYGIVSAFRDTVAPGSYLAVSHGTSDLHPASTVKRAEELYDVATAPIVLRTHDQIARFFQGWDLIPPGLVQVPLWRPEGPPPPPEVLTKIGIYGGVARRSVQS